MKLIIAGSRDLPVSPSMISKMIAKLNIKPSEVVCGMAKGVDMMGKQWADRCDITVKPFPADWDSHGKAAGPIRNGHMAEYADALLLLWDGKSRGSANMLKQAKDKELIVYQYILTTENGYNAMKRVYQ